MPTRREDNEMKKYVHIIVIFLLCLGLMSCNATDENTFDIPGNVFSVEKRDNGFFVQYQKQDSNYTYVCFLNESGNIAWEHNISAASDSWNLLKNEDSFVRTADGLKDNGFALLDKNGSLKWKIEKIDGYSDLNVAFSDNAGGVYLFGTNYNANGQSTLFHIDRNGSIVSQKPFAKNENISVLQGWYITDNERWILGERTDTNTRFLSCINADFNAIKTFELSKGQYPAVDFFPKEERILLYGQAYKNDSETEYGFVYEIDYHMNQKKYLEFNDCVSQSIIKLKDGRWLVSAYDRKKFTKDVVKLFSADWEETAALPVNYAFTRLFAMDDGGFAITGSSLSPGQPDEALYISSVRPKLDLVYERYDAQSNLTSRKTYTAQNSNSGYGYYAFVDKNGRIFLF